MNARQHPWERRSSQRFPCPGKLWYLGENDGSFMQGWTSDTSRSGVAFITACEDSLQIGQRVSICTDSPQECVPQCEEFRVCRIEPAGPLRRFVACTRFA